MSASKDARRMWQDGAVAPLGAVTSLTDSTGGTATNTLDDTTASVKDDLASLAAKVNEIIVALRNFGIIQS